MEWCVCVCFLCKIITAVMLLKSMNHLITLFTSKPNIQFFSASFNDVFKWNLSYLLLHVVFGITCWCGTLNSGTTTQLYQYTDLFYLWLHFYADYCICMNLLWRKLIPVVLRYIFRMWHFDIWLNTWQPTSLSHRWHLAIIIILAGFTHLQQTKIYKDAWHTALASHHELISGKACWWMI